MKLPFAFLLSASACPFMVVTSVTSNYHPANKSDGVIRIRLHGKYGDSNWYELDDRNKNDFERGNTDKFYINGDFSRLGYVESISIREESDDGWRFDRIKVEVKDYHCKSESYYFGGGEVDDGWIQLSEIFRANTRW